MVSKQEAIRALEDELAEITSAIEKATAAQQQILDNFFESLSVRESIACMKYEFYRNSLFASMAMDNVMAAERCLRGLRIASHAARGGATV